MGNLDGGCTYLDTAAGTTVGPYSEFEILNSNRLVGSPGRAVRSSNQILFVGGPRSSPPGWKIQGSKPILCVCVCVFVCVCIRRAECAQTEQKVRLCATYGATGRSPFLFPFSVPRFNQIFPPFGWSNRGREIFIPDSFRDDR